MMSDSSYCTTDTESDRSFSAINFGQIVQEAEAREVLAGGTVHGEMDAEDAMDDGRDDAPENQFTDDQEDPPDPPAAASIDPGEQGVMMVVNRGR
jgi:hypothetical protein